MSKKMLIGSFVVGMLLSSCGNAPGTSGTAFVLTGAYSNVDLPVGCNLVDNLIPVSFLTASFSDVTESSGANSALLVTLSAQNHTSSVTIRAISANIDYFVPGSSVQVPSAVVAFSGVASPLSDDPRDSTLPTGANSENLCEVITSTINILTPDIRDFLRFNLDVDPPIQMVATVRISGVTSAGDTVETNPISLTINLTTDTPVNGSVSSTGGTTTDTGTTDTGTDTDTGTT